jgi:hypothetical protein
MQYYQQILFSTERDERTNILDEMENKWVQALPAKTRDLLQRMAYFNVWHASTHGMFQRVAYFNAWHVSTHGMLQRMACFNA